MDGEESKQTFEESLAHLEEIVLRLEQGDLTLEMALELYEKGQKLAATCSSQLEQAALRVARLTEGDEPEEIEV